jgi:uncharacterized protein YcbK (DUF882 family)
MRVRTAARWLLVGAALFVARDAPARAVRSSNMAVESAIRLASPALRSASWARDLPAVEVASAATRQAASIRLYADDGAIDENARAALERIAAGSDDAHALAPRVEQLLVRAAYHFGNAPVVVVSAWRARASRHGTGEAIDFKLRGVSARTLAAYLRGSPRAGVGVYTNPRTQFVHLDVRDQSYHWLDASPPGVKWREAHLNDPGAAHRDATWTTEMDLP